MIDLYLFLDLVEYERNAVDLLMWKKPKRMFVIGIPAGTDIWRSYLLMKSLLEMLWFDKNFVSKEILIFFLPYIIYNIHDITCHCMGKVNCTAKSNHIIVLCWFFFLKSALFFLSNCLIFAFTFLFASDFCFQCKSFPFRTYFIHEHLFYYTFVFLSYVRPQKGFLLTAIFSVLKTNHMTSGVIYITLKRAVNVVIVW